MRGRCVSAVGAAFMMMHSGTAIPASEASDVLPSKETASDLTLPPVRSAQPGPFYPAPLRRRDLEGSVVVEFRIAVDGKVSDLRVINEKSETEFVNAAVSRIESLEFTVPTNWLESGHVNHLFRVRVAFALTPCPVATDDSDGTKVIQVCGTRIPR